MISLLTESYGAQPITFRAADGWVNATQMANAVRGTRRAVEFLRIDGTKRFIAALQSDLSKGADSHLCEVFLVRHGAPILGGGTWMHPDLALEFARWLSPEFAIWTNRVIRKVLSGQSLNESSPQMVSAKVSRLFSALETRIAALESRITAAPRRLNIPERRVGRTKEHFIGDYLPGLVQVAPCEGKRAGWCELRRVSTLSKGTFDRMLKKGLQSRVIRRHADGRYFVNTATTEAVS